MTAKYKNIGLKKLAIRNIVIISLLAWQNKIRIIIQLIIIVSFAVYGIPAMAQKADCLNKPKHFDDIGARYGKEVQEKISGWFKEWQIEKYPPSYMCKIGDKEFLVGISVAPDIGRGTYKININKMLPKDLEDLQFKRIGADKLLSAIYSKDNTPFLLLNAFSISNRINATYSDYMLLDYNKCIIDCFKPEVIHSLYEENISQEEGRVCQEGYDYKTDPDGIKTRTIKFDYKIEDKNNDGYKDLVLKISEFNCDIQNQTDFTKIYYADFGGFTLDNKGK